MAHASTMERAKLQMKKLRKQKAKKKIADNIKRSELSEEEYLESVTKAKEKSLREKAQLAIWDYKHNQYPISRYSFLETLLTDRLEEIRRKQELNCEEEIKQIEEIIDGIRS